MNNHGKEHQDNESTDKSADIMDHSDNSDKSNKDNKKPKSDLSVSDMRSLFAALDHSRDIEEEISERSQRSLVRYDEVSSFMSRASRRESLRSDDFLTESELEKRAVKVPLNNSEEATKGRLTVYQQEPISEEEVLDYYMQPEDFRRCDNDIKTTMVLWIRNKKGQGNFDPDFNTTRGLEELFDSMKHHDDNKGRHHDKRHHIKLVMEEVDRQQLSSKVLNAEKIRKVAVSSSEEAVRRAFYMGQKDEEEAFRVNPRSPEPANVQSVKSKIQKSKSHKVTRSAELPDSQEVSMAGRRGLLGLSLPAAKAHSTSGKKNTFFGFLGKKK